jgi:putative Mg2+ transporter-C (MgtC) family protein
MSTTLYWSDIAVRLVLILLAGLLIGFDRREHGKVAGLRTTMLVGLAACTAMIEVNLLLPMTGRSPQSFVMNDLMRLPLGVLTGVGFIAGGVILRRGSMITGVTPAATLWLITVIGLCLGAGLIGLGAAATALGIGVLWALRPVESVLPTSHGASLTVELDAGGPDQDAIRSQLHAAGFRIAASRISLANAGGHREFTFDLSTSRDHPDDPPSLLEALAAAPGVARIEWQSRG